LPFGTEAVGSCRRKAPSSESDEGFPQSRGVEAGICRGVKRGPVGCRMTPAAASAICGLALSRLAADPASQLSNGATVDIDLAGAWL
jgi:hypothetical protein